MGSNPIPSTVASVRIPNIRRTRIGRDEGYSRQGTQILLERPDTVVPNLESRNRIRDIYNRYKRLSSWIERIDGELDQSDRTDVLRFVEYMTDNGNATLWITRCITALISMRKFMRNSFRDSDKDDIRVLIDFIENRYFKQKHYKPTTIEKYKIILRLFYKIVYGKNKFYPEQVNWYSIKVSKDKYRDSFTLDLGEFLEEDEIEKVNNFHIVYP